jgi:sterol 3beta-glucosyltransferase
MRIDLLAIGSRGDVQPFIALGLGLNSAGHKVRIVRLDGLGDFVCGFGLEHCSITRSLQQIKDSEAGREWVQQRAKTKGLPRRFRASGGDADPRGTD